MNYIIVWSLHQSNYDILNGLSINKDCVYISSWISQITMLQHQSVVLAILHCDINGVVKARYHFVPVICFPSVFSKQLMFLMFICTHTYIIYTFIHFLLIIVCILSKKRLNVSFINLHLKFEI